MLAAGNLQTSMAYSNDALLMFVRLLPAFAKQFGADFEDALFNFTLQIDVWNFAARFLGSRKPYRQLAHCFSLAERNG
jgi:hypothetical protein